MIITKNKPILVFDGDCSFCMAWVNMWKSLSRNEVEFEPYQKVAVHYPEIHLIEFELEVKLILPTGKILGGAEAIFELLSLHGNCFWVWKWLYEKFPLFALVSDFIYKLVARNRTIASMITRIFINDKYLDKNNVKT